MLDIKIATPADISLIRELTHKIWPQTYNPIIGPEQVAYMIDLFYAPDVLRKQMAEKSHSFIIAYLDGEAVAFAAYSEVLASVFKLHKLYILPSLQGRGIGRQLIDYIINDTKNAGATQLQLNVNRYNSQAIAFYKKAGFAHLKDEDIDIGNGYFMNDHVFGLDIK